MNTARSGRPVVAIVDAYSTASHLAPLFHAAGHDCLHVRSVAEPPPVFASSFRPEDFVDTVTHRGDVAETLAAIRPYAPVALLAGAEIGVELADVLSEALGVRSNGTALSAARRDKYRMMETVRSAGVPAVDQILAGDLDTLLDWYGDTDRTVVLKPVRSALNDGVSFCSTAAEVRTAFGDLVGADSALGVRNDAVLAQEYLVGAEYYVNTVSLDGRHRVCDLWKTQHLGVNGVRDLLGGSSLMASRGPEQDLLAEYAFSVLDALGIRNGPAHTELKLTPDGPRLVETGARVCGAMLPLLTRAALGESQLEWTVLAYTDPDAFEARRRTDYPLTRHAVCVNMIAPESGKLLDYPKLDELRALESFHDVLLKVRPGEELSRTVNDLTYPMLVHLVHEVEGVVTHDYMTARHLDGEGFYHVV
ncbi:ATP-grasp domain-containing protein [Streptomyces alkaliterrae]|uniref:ATP-grasp domain-containing protein n=1 Tax=Streptomyces alkaliterrae TaxID=2213162 RepID=A0A5P0YTE0_9ACTN|nr:ATP-grasp domain-containing protein [Streptomyces alkaliterrae]MBB1253542.1 ATP-grasp domain-containing protein [Streptomyces alkaliterrae]MBB1257670.1 ATP-grasp domain-containing protein [Streptomyces alkaliterrae]MQS01749.1 ATP-grasp domain-containing protein [Streptomyces alkaliterrae]